MNVGDIMTEVSKVKGVGPKSVQLLNKIGINTVDDLVTHYPYRYDLLERTNLKEAGPDDKVIIDGRIESVPILLRFKAGLNKLNFRLVTNTGIVGISIFNRAFMKNNLTIGTNIIVIGKYDSVKNIKHRYLLLSIRQPVFLRSACKLYRTLRNLFYIFCCKISTDEHEKLSNSTKNIEIG